MNRIGKTDRQSMQYNKWNNSLSAPILIHLELTEKCPLNCPQCYCDLSKGRDLDLQRVFDVLEEAARIRVRCIALSGGEPLVYPHLLAVVRKINSLKMTGAIATSGVGLTDDRIGQLSEAGLNLYYVSLNGSRKEIADMSRGKYEEAIKAIELLVGKGIICRLNWVARHDNINDFSDMIKLGKDLGVNGIDILLQKFNYNFEMTSPMTSEDTLKLVETIKTEREEGKKDDSFLKVEGCYSDLKKIIRDRVDSEFQMGCSAGRSLMAVNVEGDFLPCRHLNFPESKLSILDYWQESVVLKKLRKSKSKKNPPCTG